MKITLPSPAASGATTTEVRVTIDPRSSVTDDGKATTLTITSEHPEALVSLAEMSAYAAGLPSFSPGDWRIISDLLRQAAGEDVTHYLGEDERKGMYSYYASTIQRKVAQARVAS